MAISVNYTKWRVGRKVGRTIYAMVKDEPSDEDILIGIMDTKEIADEVIWCHNQMRYF